MRRHVHGLDGLSGGLHWQTGTLGVNDTERHQDHRAKTATRGCVYFTSSRIPDYREKMFTFGKERVREDKKRKPTVKLFNLQLGGG